MKDYNKASDIFANIRAKWSCLSYARDILGLPVYRDGDRCTSIAPGEHHHDDAFVCYTDSWYDYTFQKGGDVTALCAWAKYQGDMRAAMMELGREFIGSDSIPAYSQFAKNITEKVSMWHDALRPQDRQYLHDRRISDETIDRLKMGYCGNPKSEMYDRIVIPFWVNGSPVYYAGRDCSGKWKDRAAKVAKYKKMFTGGTPYSENVMWGQDSLAHDWCTDPEKDSYLCILEGMFDAMSFYQERWHVLSPIGGFFSKKLMPLLASHCKRFKKVFICFDNDGPGVAFQRSMAKFLMSNNIPFVCGHVGTEYNGQPVKDVSDFYALGGNLSDLVHDATEGTYDLAESFQSGDEEEFRDFMLKAGRYCDSAKMILMCKRVRLDSDFVKACLKEAKRPPLEGDIASEVLESHNLLYMVNDSFYEYEHGVWNAKHDLAVQSYSRSLLGRFARASNMAAVSRHIQALKWYSGQFNKQNILNLLNGVLDFSDFTLQPHSPSYMSSIQVPHVFRDDATCPRWIDYLDTVMEGNAQKIRLLQQFCGYIFSASNRECVALFLMGDGSNGKSVFIETLRYVLDPRNCASVRLSDMGDKFEPLALKDVLVNMTTETSIDLKGAEDAIKTIIAGETIRAAHKGVDAVQFESRAKMICACNSFIASKDVTYAFMRRLKFVNFGKTFTDADADKNLLTELRSEASGILNWMIAGYKDLQECGGFITTDEELMLREIFLEQANPLAAFINMELKNQSGQMTAQYIYDTLYVPWTKRANTGTISLPKFGRLFRSLMRQLRPDVEYGRDEYGKRCYNF